MTFGRDEPVYAIGVVARIVGIHQQTLRNYERIGLVVPGRSEGGSRLYSQRDLDRIQQIREWMEDLGINLAGVEVMTRLLQRINELEDQVTELTMELVRTRQGGRALPSGPDSPDKPAGRRSQRPGNEPGLTGRNRSRNGS